MSPFLLNDSVEDMDESCSRELPGKQYLFALVILTYICTYLCICISCLVILLSGDKIPDSDIEFQRGSLNYNYDCLKEIDPLAASRIHPNDRRKVRFCLLTY